MRQRLATLAAPALFSAGCNEPEVGQRGWHGVARRGCGPGDGPAVETALDAKIHAACTTSHMGEARIHTGDWHYDWLKAGKVLGFVARFRAEPRAGTSGKSLSGTVLLKPCPVRPFPGFCG